MAKPNKLVNSLRNATIVMLLVSSALAQGVPKLDIRINEEKINMTTLERRPGAEVSYTPGDTIKYFIIASNVGDGLMTNPEIVDPIPAGVTYVAESATGENTEILFSIDQGKAFMEWPPYYSVRNSRGVLVKRQATPEMITHVKWNIKKNMNPGEQALMDFRVVVSK